MKHLTKALEQRIFISYFVVTFILVLVLITLEWQLVKYSINLNENVNINKAQAQDQVLINDQAMEIRSRLSKLAKNDTLKTFLTEKKYEEIVSFFSFQQTIVFNENKQLVVGEYWDFIGQYVEGIFTKKIDGFFISSFGEKLFLLFYQPIYNEENIIGYMIEASKIAFSNQYDDLNIKKLNFSYPLNTDLLPEELIGFKNKLEDEISELSKKSDSKVFLRLSMNTTISISVNKDIYNNPVLIDFYVYDRYINSFAQKSIVFFVLILLAITLIMIGLLGNWFSKTILSPIKSLSDRMKEIAHNPSIIEPLETPYKGVLGDLVYTFNSMNNSIETYSKSLSEYKNITDNLNSGIFWLDVDFKILLCNPALLEILEIENYENILKYNLNDFLQLPHDLLSKAKQDSLTLSSWEIKVRDKKKYVTMNIRKMNAESSKKIVGSVTDITSEVIEKQAREALEIELIKSNKLAEIGRRVEGIVHNLNSPLNSVLGYAQLLKKNHHHEDLDKIIESGKIISHYIKTLQQKIKKDNTSMMHPIDINSLIDQELELCRHNLFFKHYVKLQKKFSKNLPQILAVYGDMSLCIANILNNAIESLHERDNKEISVSTDFDKKNLFIHISDTGWGIKTENLEKIFKPYFSTKSGKENVSYGLGLAICKHITDKYQGSIHVKSEVNTGSQFIIQIPINREQNE